MYKNLRRIHFILVIGLGIFNNNNAFGQNCNGKYLQAVYDTIDVIKNVAFGQNLNYQGTPLILKADVYVGRHDTNRKRPAVLVLFGGSFISGSRISSGIPQFAQALAARGFVGIAIDYRIGVAGYNGTEMTKAVYRATQDALAAIRYFRANADTFGIDSSQIFASGFSAGAITCLHAAFWNQSEVLPAVDTALMGTLATGSGNPGISGRISGVLSAAGGIDDTAWINPSEKIPVGSYHNSGDPTVPYGYNTLPIVNLPIYGSSLVTARQLHLGHQAWLKTVNISGLHIPQVGDPQADTMSLALLADLYKMLKCNQSVTVIGPTNFEAEAWKIYPVPAQTYFNIRPNPYLIQQSTQFRLFNSTGKMVFSGEMQPDYSSQSFNLPTLPSGLYTLCLQSGSLAETKRIIVNR